MTLYFATGEAAEEEWVCDMLTSQFIDANLVHSSLHVSFRWS